MPQEKLRRGVHLETVEKLSKPEGLDVREYAKDIVASGIGVDVYGQTFTDPQDAVRLKKKRIREARSETAKEFASPNTPISEVTKENSGVLDAQIAKSKATLPKINQEIEKIEFDLENSDLAGYQRGRLEDNLSDLERRKEKHESNIRACIDRLNVLFGSGR